MAEGFRPFSHQPPTGFKGALKFYGRMPLDLQFLTIFRQAKKMLPSFSGEVLDVGCGQSPYRFLLNAAATKYTGIDIVEAGNFDYNNPDIISFNGRDIPFEDGKFNGIICTEVLEHVAHYQHLVNEIHRVMKKGGTAFITIPWSARYHYMPHDYFRYTPSTLKTMFAGFSDVQIINRGSDISNLANKVIVLWFRNLLPQAFWRWLFVPFWILTSPIMVLTIIAAHLSLWFNWGSEDDPLGYTVIAKK